MLRGSKKIQTHIRFANTVEKFVWASAVVSQGVVCVEIKRTHSAYLCRLVFLFLWFDSYVATVRGLLIEQYQLMSHKVRVECRYRERSTAQCHYSHVDFHRE